MTGVQDGLRSTLMRILLLNGPNLNLLGTREPEIYGSTSLPELEQMCRQWADELGHQLEGYQSNHEGALIDAIHGARGVFDGIVLNGGAFSHTSYAIHDALQSAGVPTVEIHISNIRAREEWRRHSVVAPATSYQIFGRGIDGYQAAIHRLHHDHLSPATVHGEGHPDRIGDLRLPDGEGPHPAVVLIHGGFWREIYTRDTLDSLAVDLVGRGYATWNVEYRRVPPIGGWRTTISDVVDAIDAVHALAERVPIDVEKTIVLGHSAGAHLAVLAAARIAHPIAKMVLLGGVLDLSLLPTEHGALPIFLGDELDTHRDAVDPCQHIPVDIATLVVHGTDDTSVDPTHSTNYVAAARSGNAEVTHVSLDGSDHWDIIDASSPAWENIAGQF